MYFKSRLKLHVIEKWALEIRERSQIIYLSNKGFPKCNGMFGKSMEGVVLTKERYKYLPSARAVLQYQQYCKSSFGMYGIEPGF